MRALVTGAGSGIGRATALELQNRGWEVLAGVRNWHAAMRDGELKNPVEFDVRDWNWRCSGPIDALVACAGYSLWGPLEAIRCYELEELLRVNVVGVHHAVRVTLPFLRERGGKVVLIGSTADQHLALGTGAYALSKTALRTYTEALALELEPFGVRVRLYEPGKVATNYARNRTLAEDLLGDVGRAYLDAHAATLPPRERDGEEPVEILAGRIANYCENG